MELILTCALRYSSPDYEYKLLSSSIMSVVNIIINLKINRAIIKKEHVSLVRTHERMKRENKIIITTRILKDVGAENTKSKDDIERLEEDLTFLCLVLESLCVPV